MAEQKEMLKPDNPAWATLIADIQIVLSSRSDDGYAFTSWPRPEQWDFFLVSGFSGPYVDQGMSEAQVTAIIRNALEGKPQEKWLNGVFDGHALKLESKDRTSHLNAHLASASFQGRKSTHGYNRLLDDAVERGKFRQRSPDKGHER